MPGSGSCLMMAVHATLQEEGWTKPAGGIGRELTTPSGRGMFGRFCGLDKVLDSCLDMVMSSLVLVHHGHRVASSDAVL